MRKKISGGWRVLAFVGLCLPLLWQPTAEASTYGDILDGGVSQSGIYYSWSLPNPPLTNGYYARSAYGTDGVNYPNYINWTPSESQTVTNYTWSFPTVFGVTYWIRTEWRLVANNNLVGSAGPRVFYIAYNSSPTNYVFNVNTNSVPLDLVRDSDLDNALKYLMFGSGLLSGFLLLNLVGMLWR